MAYSDFKTLEQVNQELGIIIEGDSDLYRHIEPVQLTNWFVETMKMAYIPSLSVACRKPLQTRKIMKFS